MRPLLPESGALHHRAQQVTGGAGAGERLYFLRPVRAALSRFCYFREKRGGVTMARTLLMQGNQAVVEGAIAAGVRFYGGYPITPSTEIAEGMAKRLPEVWLKNTRSSISVQ